MRERLALSPIEAAEAVVAAIRARIWIVIAFAVALPALAVAYNAASSHYEGRVEVAFTPISENEVLVRLGLPAQGVPSGEQMISDEVLNGVIEEVDLVISVNELRDRLRVEQPAGDRRATLVAEGDSSEEARSIVSAWATRFVVVRNQLVAQQFDAIEQATERQLAAAERRDEVQLQRDLQLKLADLEAARATARGDTEVTRAATATSGAGSKISEFAALAAALFLGILVAGGLALLDRRLRTPPVAAAAFDLPLLGVIPTGGSSSAKPHSRAVVAASQVSAWLTLAPSPDNRDSILITPVGGAGSQLPVAAALAASFAESGLSTALVWWCCRDANGEPTAPSAVSGLSNSGRWRELEPRVAELAESHDAVIIASPALDEHGDVLLASQATGQWIVCAALGEVRGDDADAARRVWRGLSRTPAGLVVTEPRAEDDDATPRSSP